jgi:hypothetical protein
MGRRADLSTPKIPSLVESLAFNNKAKQYSGIFHGANQPFMELRNFFTRDP